MANKATTDGVVFQQHLYYYVIGVVHSKYNYAVLYEGREQTYGALDDVILKIYPDAEAKINDGLYLIQAKQTVDETKTLSIQDLLHYKVNITKYIESYIKYRKSEAHTRDGLPTEMIYWATNDFHTSSKQFVEEHISSEPHLSLTVDTMRKYSIKHWKALFMYDTALKLAATLLTPKKETDKPQAYLCDSVAKVLAHEILEAVSTTPDGGIQPTVRFQEKFLRGDPSLSKNAAQFRKSFIIACNAKLNNPKSTFNIDSLTATEFTTDAFGLIDFAAGPPTDVCLSRMRYAGLDEDELDWFFKRFVFYMKVPKDETMLEAIEDLFNNQFNEKLFERYLLKKPLKRALLVKDKKQQQQDCFLAKPYIDALMKIIELKCKLVATAPKGIEFKEESVEQLCTEIRSSFDVKNMRELTVLAKTKLEWTISRIALELRNTLVVSKHSDFGNVVEALQAIRSVQFGEHLISGEVQFILLCDVPNTADCLKLLADELSVKVVTIVSDNSESNIGPIPIQDEIAFHDLRVDYDELNIKYITIDARDVPITSFLSYDSIDSIEKLVELSILQDVVVKSDIFDLDMQHYIDRNLIGEGNRTVTHTELLQTAPHVVSIICDTAGQGKTMELLRIARITQDIEGVVCLFLRAKTIAKGVTQLGTLFSSLDGLQVLEKVLHITPRSFLVDNIILQCLAKTRVCLLVDGFDEIVDTYQDLVLSFLQKVLKSATCSLIIATRNESMAMLKKSFKNACYYNLGSFSYEKYFNKLWLSDKNNITPELEQNVQIFISNFDQLLKTTGCKSFLEVPQLCKIMGIIYQDRIRKPNIQWHNNYEIGSIYDTFVQSQFDNTIRGKFDETDKLHVWAKQLIKHDYYIKHEQLAYELEHNHVKNLDHYKQLTRFGLIMIQFDSSECVEFMHRTVMEYFLVRVAMLGDMGNEEFLSFIKRYFCVSRANLADKLIDFFLANKKCPSYDKKRILSLYLHSNSNLLATCIRMTLNNATFNTLRLLLSVAPKRMLKNLCFRFGATVQSGPKNFSATNEINLKRLGERQMILLLNALKECENDEDDSDDDSESDDGLNILQRMLFEMNPTEEDTLEVAIRKPFSEVFDWIVAYCTKNFSPFVQIYLMKRLPRYAQAIIRHCYAENKDKIIDKIIKLCGETLPSAYVQNCLESFDLLGELIVSIEVVPQGKQFKEEDRKDLTQKITSLYDSYLDGDRLQDLKNRSKDQVETVQNEAIKTVLKRWMNK